MRRMMLQPTTPVQNTTNDAPEPRVAQTNVSQKAKTSHHISEDGRTMGGMVPRRA